ncbi:FixH family protein [Domibacillus robiginosus]|uniref:FixH family protein n=1 Tax=Domibacillus robiginosus TaxID=1071054 RepID=UPI00067B89FE|nr:FixH family protein [Domibacillus robiginosus]
MNKWILLGSLLLLSGCALDPDVADEYVVEEKLDAEIDVKNGLIQVTTSQEADVSVSFWAEGEEAERLNLTEEKNGVYTAEKKLTDKGAYFVKADIQTDGQHIMPTKKIWVGVEPDVEQDEPSMDKKHHH